MRKLTYKHGRHTVDKHLGHKIFLSNQDKKIPEIYNLEDVEINGELEITAKCQVWDYFDNQQKVDGFDLSKLDLSMYKDESDYTRWITKGGWFNKRKVKVFRGGRFLRKERQPYHQRTNVKWTIVTDDGFNFEQKSF